MTKRVVSDHLRFGVGEFTRIPPPIRSGVDRIELSEFTHIVSAGGENFVKSVFTSAERDYCEARIDRLATRFAAKEAMTKALGTGIRGLSLREIEVVSAPNGQPEMRLHDRAYERALSLGIIAISVSLTHTSSMAEAFVVTLTDALSPAFIPPQFQEEMYLGQFKAFSQ